MTDHEINKLVPYSAQVPEVLAAYRAALTAKRIRVTECCGPVHREYDINPAKHAPDALISILFEVEIAGEGWEILA